MRLGAARSHRADAGASRLSWSDARQLSLAKPRRMPYRLQVEAVEELGILPDSASALTDPALLPADRDAATTAFADAINAKLAHSRSKDIVVYVHGYKVPFENPLLVATELWHFMGYDGVVIPSSWPSIPRLLAYFSDVETTGLSARYLRQFISYLHRRTAAERIHVVGVSSGASVSDSC